MRTSQVPRANVLKNHLYKRWFDVIVVLTSHIILLPIWIFLRIFIPIVIWIDSPGPIFHRQRRIGFRGQVFTVLKFRTMVPNAEELGPTWTVADDPRITRVGKVLRRIALDELPELINILRGEMSLVGPRALDVSEHRVLEETISGFKDRLIVRPGLTGMAQVLDKRDDAADKLKYDLEYIRRMNMWLDIRLLILSVINTFFGRWDRRTGKSGSPNRMTKP